MNATCPLCGLGCEKDPAGRIVAHAPAASCPEIDRLRASAKLTPPHPDRPCCAFFGIGHTMYKGVYLPSREEYVAHGYKAENFGHAMLQWQASIDATGRP